MDRCAGISAPCRCPADALLRRIATSFPYALRKRRACASGLAHRRERAFRRALPKSAKTAYSRCGYPNRCLFFLFRETKTGSPIRTPRCPLFVCVSPRTAALQGAAAPCWRYAHRLAERETISSQLLHYITSLYSSSSSTYLLRVAILSGLSAWNFLTAADALEKAIIVPAPPMQPPGQAMPSIR